MGRMDYQEILSIFLSLKISLNKENIFPRNKKIMPHKSALLGEENKNRLFKTE